MIRTFVLVLWVFLEMSPFVYAGYRDLKNSFETYEPSAYYHDQFRPAPERKPLPVDDSFHEEKKRIEDIKSHWEKYLVLPKDETIFFQPDPERLSSLKSAETDITVASDALQKAFSLETVEALTFLRNPGIKAAKYRFRGALEAFTQVSELDDILRQYTAFTEEIATGVGPMKGKEPMKVKFPFPGVLSLKAQVVLSEVSAEKERLEAARRDAVTSVRIAYWNLVYVIKAKQITNEMVELLQYLETVDGTRYQAGKTNYQDVIKVRISRETLDEELITLTQRRRNIDAKIREVLDLPPEIKLGTPDVGRPPGKIPSLQNLYKIAYEHRQELQRLRAKVVKMERMIEMAETMILPQFTFGFSFYEDEAVNKAGSFAKKKILSRLQLQRPLERVCQKCPGMALKMPICANREKSLMD